MIADSNEIVRCEWCLGSPDYVEIRNVSAEPVLLDEYALIDAALDADDRFVFPAQYDGNVAGQTTQSVLLRVN